MDRTIAHYMTPSPHTIGVNQPLAVAHRLMREHNIRHLPVLDCGELVGLVSQRDLLFIETLKDVDPNQVTVAEAMSPSPYVVSPHAQLERVVANMATRKLGAAVIVQRKDVLGVFTSVDALHVLSELLSRSRRRQLRRDVTERT